MPLLLADFIYSRDCRLNLRKKVDTRRCGQKVGLNTLKREIERCIQKINITKLSSGPAGSREPRIRCSPGPCRGKDVRQTIQPVKAFSED